MIITLFLLALIVIGIALIYVGEKRGAGWLEFVGKVLYTIALFVFLVHANPLKFLGNL